MSAPRLLVTAEHLSERRAVATGPLAALAASLASELEPWTARDLYVPTAKAALTRAGGTCARDGARLDFDPGSPWAHRCPRCGAVYDGEAHHRSWVTWYHLWLAERAVHGALLGALGAGPSFTAFASAVLERYDERYLEYENADNVLGPTRPFFSTYLESIWLLQLCVALDLLEAADDTGATARLGGRLRDRVVAPSRALIASYDEGASNRQVWNVAAMVAASRSLGDDRSLERLVDGPSGVASHLRGGLLADGSWYEGENYHLFAHRGLWYAVAMCERAGVALDPALVRRFDAGFAVPFLTALPDMTFPARRDSQYGVSLRQWRFAELAELGVARRDDRRLASALGTLYDPSIERRDTGRWRSTADAERNEPASRLTRADLSWRSLLFARPALDGVSPAAAASVLLPAQGLAVFRRHGGAVYAAMDYGHSGGGHGHPDRLGLIVSRGADRILDDPGTGSYVERALHWYRSTLAHGAPLVDGASQRRTSGELVAYEERDAAGWVVARAAIARGVVATRTLVVLDDYLVDELSWTADREVVLDLPWHLGGEVAGDAPWVPDDPSGASGLEDGFDFLRDAERLARDARRVVVVTDPSPGAPRAWFHGADEWWRAVAPGPPGREARRFHFARARGAVGRLTSVVAWRAVRDATIAGDTVSIALDDATTHVHARTADGWRIAFHALGARSSVDLAGWVAHSPSDADVASLDGDDGNSLARATLRVPLAAGDAPPADAVAIALGRDHYRRSERSWEEAGAPTANVTVWRTGETLWVRVVACTGSPRFAAAATENPLDNEHPDVNSDGVQLHLAPIDLGGRTTAEPATWLLVPEPGERVRSTARGPAASASEWSVTARWSPARGGYVLDAEVALGTLAGRRVALDVIVNQLGVGRARREGQLVLSGARGEFVYLRGDRQPPDRYLLLDLSPSVAT